jgi:hypothetical protein
VALSAGAASSLEAVAGGEAVAQQTFTLHGAGSASELLRAKKELEGSLAELRMCRQQGRTWRAAGSAGTS